MMYANIFNNDIKVRTDNRDEIEELLNDDLFCDYAITGNASGSYTFSRINALENLSMNFDLLAEALEAFGRSGYNIIKDGPEACDVTIRCYLLPQAIAAVLDEVEETDEAEDEDEE